MKEVTIGEQTWGAENMALTTTPEGEELKLGVDYFYPNGDKKLVEKYGLLYTWNAAMKVSPKGWHLPTNEEWTELEDYCSAHYAVGGDKDNVAKALASDEGWNYSRYIYAVGNNLSTNNKSGFSAIPAGYHDYDDGRYEDFGYCTFFWSATLYSSNRAYNILLFYNDSEIYKDNDGLNFGFSVRLLKDKEDPKQESRPDRYKEYWKSIGHCTDICINEDGEEC